MSDDITIKEAATSDHLELRQAKNPGIYSRGVGAILAGAKFPGQDAATNVHVPVDQNKMIGDAPTLISREELENATTREDVMSTVWKKMGKNRKQRRQLMARVKKPAKKARH